MNTHSARSAARPSRSRRLAHLAALTLLLATALSQISCSARGAIRTGSGHSHSHNYGTSGSVSTSASAGAY